MRIVIYSALIGFLLLLVLTIIVYRNYKQKKALALQLREQKKEILVQNEEIKSQNEQLSALNEKLEKTGIMLQELNATKDKFFSIVAHDLKNPFSVLQSMSDVLAGKFDELDNEYKRTIAQTIKQAVDSSYSLVENLLLWSRSQSVKVNLQPEKLNLKQLIQRNIDLVVPDADSKNIDLQMEAGDNATALADENYIDTVIRNLLTNAIKFTPENGKVKISASLH